MFGFEFIEKVSRRLSFSLFGIIQALANTFFHIGMGSNIQ